jgi:galactofuranosylgalactofuranosylrhamnosyl-N-acetylglucosaminyl-diphospho-decaprenol beta-1,5/1,6-galactofuranosyltransferase
MERNDMETSNSTCTSTLQSLVFPNLEVRASEDMYLRLDARCWAELAAPAVHFEAGGTLTSDTFFNGFTVDTWKRHCDIASLSLALQGEGDFVLTFGLHRRDRASAWLAEHRIALHAAAPTSLPLPAWEGLSDGLLFFRLRALGPAVLRGGAFQTAGPPLRVVCMGLVITHFNRQAQVLPAIQRIRRSLLDHPELKAQLTLTVVDNSRNLSIEAHPRISYIANRNLGGTGGFVRGLLQLIDSHHHTHALFMDDDASCETASIARCLALLQHARHGDLAVAGALLREMHPWELMEKGARFDGQVVPLHSGLDMRRVPDLLEAERPGPRPDYGAWWFFAFPIAEVRQFPFPFFVRGDDVLFGLGNRFRIVTMNGIACFGEDFGSKHGPVTAYLDARYHLVHALLAPSGAAARIFWVGSRLFLKALTSYLYTSARAVTLAMQHTLRGPIFFAENIDMQAVRARIGAWTPAEKMQPIDRGEFVLKGPRRRPESALRRLLRIVTLQGFLLPGWLLRDRMTVQAKHFHGRASAVFRYRKVLYEHAPSGTGFVAEFDRRRFFQELGGFLKAWLALFQHLPTLRRDYAAGLRDMAAIEFWRDVYPESRPDADETAPAFRDLAETAP